LSTRRTYGPSPEGAAPARRASERNVFDDPTAYRALLDAFPSGAGDPRGG